MTSKRKNTDQKEEEGLSKEQDEIARFVRFNCPTNSTLFEGNEVHYFTGCKAVDTLYESSYGTKAKGEPKFTSRASAANYMKTLLEARCFFRAKKLVAKKKEKEDKKSQMDSKDKKKKEDETETESEQKEKPTDDKMKESKGDKEEDKKKKKIKLEFHDIQAFNDDKDVYVWVFDPTPLYKKVVGLLMLLGTIAGCLYPIWPEWLRMGVYYLSMTGVGAVGLLIVVAIARTILFCIIWLVTLGQHKLWILPNLTEDCGFFESFKPAYTYEYCPRGVKVAKKDDKKKRKKDKDSDNEDAAPVKESVSSTDKKEKGSESGSASVSNSDEDQSATCSASEAGSTPATPADASVKKRRVRRADDDFVVVNN